MLRPPAASPFMRMRWLNLAFIHWPIEASALRGLIPRDLEIHTFDGRAWVGLVPFTMRDVLPARAPQWRWLESIPTLSAFHECNVRTYVHPVGRPDEPGVWFFSLDAASRAAVWAARRFYHLPYFCSRISLERKDVRVRFAVQRIDRPHASMQCAWRIGESLPCTQDGQLLHFLTHRYSLYVCDKSGAMWRGRIWHDPWPLRCGELIALDDGLVSSAGIKIEFTQPPLVHVADELAVHAWPLERV